jgi:hypothetical protein
MSTINRPIPTSAMLILLLGILSLPALAQHEDMVRIGKKGVIPFDTPVRVGDTLLKPGSYQIQHVMEGQDHVIVFKKMLDPSPGYGPATASEKETTRMKCRVEPLGEKAKYGLIRFGKNAAGEKTVEEVQILGENVKHVF